MGKRRRSSRAGRIGELAGVYAFAYGGDAPPHPVQHLEGQLLEAARHVVMSLAKPVPERVAHRFIALCRALRIVDRERFVSVVLPAIRHAYADPPCESR